MGFLFFFSIAAVPFAGLAIWKLYVRTGHSGGPVVATAALAIAGLIASLSTLVTIFTGYFGMGLVIGPAVTAIAATLITGAALWLALKPWPGSAR